MRDNDVSTEAPSSDASPNPGAVRISAIMPVYNGAEFLVSSLPPLAEMRERGEILEVIVVNDGSTDNSVEIAQSAGARVLETGGREGVGVARNLGAAEAMGEILWFVDADVVVHENAARVLTPAFMDPTTVSVFGSYDDSPMAPNFLSQYKNLLHHYHHQRARAEATTFWAGCGAVRKKAFLAVGGFDTVRYTLPSIEDIELGGRLHAAGGRIRVLPELNGKHLKVWKLGPLVHTEIFRRAIPWARLMLETDDMVNDLNVSVAERFKAVLAGIFALSVVAFIIGLLPWWIPCLVTLATGAANWDLVRFFYRRNGLIFCLGALFFHQFYYLYSSVAFAWVVLEHRFARVPS